MRAPIGLFIEIQNVQKKPKEHINIEAKQVASANELEPYKQPMFFLFDDELRPLLIFDVLFYGC